MSFTSGRAVIHKLGSGMQLMDVNVGLTADAAWDGYTGHFGPKTFRT